MSSRSGEILSIDISYGGFSPSDAEGRAALAGLIGVLRTGGPISADLARTFAEDLTLYGEIAQNVGKIFTAQGA